MKSIESANGVVPENIKKIIKDKGFKQGAVAKKAGYTEQEFSDMLCGRRLIKVVDIQNIANALEVYTNRLFGVIKSEFDVIDSDGELIASITEIADTSAERRERHG